MREGLFVHARGFLLHAKDLLYACERASFYMRKSFFVHARSLLCASETLLCACDRLANASDGEGNRTRFPDAANAYVFLPFAFLTSSRETCFLSRECEAGHRLLPIARTCRSAAPGRPSPGRRSRPGP